MSAVTVPNSGSRTISPDFEGLYREHSPIVYRTAKGILGNSHDAEGEGGRRGGADPVLGYGPAYPNMRDALQAQLGLRVEQTRIPTDFVVIEHVEKPSGN